MKIDEMLSKLGSELVNSPFLSVMVVNKKYQIVWHNQRFAEEFAQEQQILGQTCFQAIGSPQVHEDCPLQDSIKTQTSHKEFLDFGQQYFLYMTIPLDEEHAAKVHIFLPKDANTGTTPE